MYFCNSSIEDGYMKSLVLEKIHEELKAKMVPFAGFNMPVQYAGVTAEHLCVREHVGIFDVSHMGEFAVMGPKALDLIQWVTSNDASKLKDGDVQYSCFPNGKGGIVDALLVYRFAENKYMLVVNASNIQKDWDWLVAQNERFGAELSNKSDQYCLFAVQGPKAASVLQTLTSEPLAEIPYYKFKLGDFAGFQNVILSATGYTGAGGFEIYVPNHQAVEVWTAIMKAGEPFGIQPIGLAARDTLRLEMGYCLYGNDIDDSTSPIEAGLSWITKFNKSFVDSEFLKEQKESGVSRRLVGFKLVDRGIPRKDYEVKNKEGVIIGKVTSGTMSPSLKEAVGMAYVESSYALPDAEVFIEVRGKLLRAKVSKLPFYR